MATRDTYFRPNLHPVFERESEYLKDGASVHRYKGQKISLDQLVFCVIKTLCYKDPHTWMIPKYVYIVSEQ